MMEFTCLLVLAQEPILVMNINVLLIMFQELTFLLLGTLTDYQLTWFYGFDGNNFYNSDHRSVGVQVMGKSGSIHYATPQLVKNSSGAFVLACYTGSYWVLATSPSTTITISGKMENKIISVS